MSGRYNAGVCGYRGVEKRDFVDRYSSYTKRFEGYVSTLCQKLNLTDAVDVAELDWKMVKRIANIRST